jgi:hypothetical protein
VKELPPCEQWLNSEVSRGDKPVEAVVAHPEPRCILEARSTNSRTCTAMTESDSNRTRRALASRLHNEKGRARGAFLASLRWLFIVARHAAVELKIGRRRRFRSRARQTKHARPRGADMEAYFARTSASGRIRSASNGRSRGACRKSDQDHYCGASKD